MTGIIRTLGDGKHENDLRCLRRHFDALAMLVMAQQSRAIVRRRLCQYYMDVWVVAMARSIVLGRAGYALYTLATHRCVAWWWQMTFLPTRQLSSKWLELRHRSRRGEASRLFGRWMGYVDLLEVRRSQLRRLTLEAPRRWMLSFGCRVWRSVAVIERSSRQALAYEQMRVHQREAGVESVIEDLRRKQASIWLRLWRGAASFRSVTRDLGCVYRSFSDRRRKLLGVSDPNPNWGE